MSDEVTQPIDIAVTSRSPAEKPRRLGKGLGALLGETRREEPLVRRDDVAEGGTAVGTS
ncbi:MAG: chromosome partitioning protein ParB, partial [Alphaproteobacteria bacterium HGW-Alphaproteobacteria-9]